MADKEKHLTEIEGEVTSPATMWVVPYGNLMTILMIFFLVLYAFSFVVSGVRFEKIVQSLQKDVGGEVNKEYMERVVRKAKEREVAEEMDGLIDEKRLKKFANVRIDKEGIKVVFRSPVVFDLGKAELKPEIISVLGAVARVIKDMPNEVMVGGHTDDKPIISGEFRSNWELSAARAFSVIRYFIEQGVDPGRLSAIGYGEYRPLYPNDTEEHRAFNRRIEIDVVSLK
ncbi:OmpA family protein [bacterium]|nr:OmpA family protein [bacterium]NIN92229.1 OmpA family protein [bacterium]NIO18371.1 OmpA family protein [bacterium]NIO73350.1 OmpA family protein [bacterium]